MSKQKINNDVLSKIILNENIYIYTKKSKKFYPARAIQTLFDEAKKDKEGKGCKTLLTIKNINKETENKVSFKFSALVLKYVNVPSFLSEYIKDWVEQKLAYLFLFDFGEYLILLKRNIGGIQAFIDSNDSLDYEIIAKLFIENNTLYEKFSLQNLDISSRAMRAKSVESDNLTENYNYIGSNTYKLNYLRLNSDSQRYVISLNSSKISKAGEKISIEKMADWCYELIIKVKEFKTRECFLDLFAKPYNYQIEKNNLNPSTITLLLSKLIEDITTNKIVRIVYVSDNHPRAINLIKYIHSSSISVSLLEDKPKISFKAVFDSILPKFLKDFGITLHEKSIRVNSTRLRKIRFSYENGTSETLIDYLNHNNCFVINFDQVDFVYSNKQLFRDSSLLGNIEYFLKIFEPDPEIESITSEKGNVAASSIDFEQNSMFGYVEKKYSDSDFLILDDLGDEWADHICIKDLTVCFIHSKFDLSIFSATAFTEIIGQALKNIGNIFSVDSSIRHKKAIWLKKYNLEKIQSQIKRLRKGNSIDDFIDKYIKVKLEVNAKRSICLALNFISKKELEQNLNHLKKGESFGKRKQAIQILWFISSLIANCKDNNVEVKILCKP